MQISIGACGGNVRAWKVSNSVRRAWVLREKGAMMKSMTTVLALALLASGAAVAHGGMGGGAMHGGQGEAGMGACALKRGSAETAGAEACPMHEGRGMGGRMGMNAAPGGAEGCPMHAGAGPQGKAGGPPRDGQGRGGMRHEGMQMHRGAAGAGGAAAPEAPAK
jgi:hypothetical protein